MSWPDPIRLICPEWAMQAMALDLGLDRDDEHFGETLDAEASRILGVLVHLVVYDKPV